MNNKFKKKKGSSLLIVVAMFSILSILVMSVLAMTTSGYNMRIKNNERVENFYGADSGLEITQSLLYKYLSEAVQDANSRVVETDSMEKKKEQFRKAYLEYLTRLTVNELTIEKEINDMTSYGDLARANEITINSELFIIKNNKKIVPENGNKHHINKDSKLRAQDIKAVNFNEIKSFELYVESKFIKDGKERVVSVFFEIGVPEYGKELIKSKLAEAPNVLNYIIGVDGNYILENTGSTDVYGDLWVKGRTEDDAGNKIVIDKNNKYDNGIQVKTKNTKGEIGFKGNIATFSNLKIDNTMVDFEGNKTTNTNRSIFARNIILNNKDQQKDDILGNEVDLYVYNDLVIEGTKNSVLVDNFYGINDINSYKNSYNLKNAEKSSSIIVNVDDYGSGSNFIVENDAYILGTPYVDIGDMEGFQTGQAISVNNLMRPYTFKDYSDIVDGKPVEYTYDYKGNLHIVDKKNGKDLTLEDKRELFNKYYSNLSEKDKIIANGTKINNIYAVGGILNKGSLVTMNKLIDMNTVRNLQNKYVQEVFNMGEKGNYTELDFWNKNLNETVESSFNWEGISKVINDNYLSNPSLKKVNGNNNFIHLQTKMTVNEVIKHSKTEGGNKHPLTTYGELESVSGAFNLNLIFTDSDKPVRIVSTESKNNQLKEVNGELIYEIDLKTNKNNETSHTSAAPILVISKNNVVVEDHTGFNFSMIISSKDAELKLFKPTPLIGNYSTPSSNGDRIGYENGQFKIINELFKYALENSDIVGDIGNGIFKGGEEIVSNNAIEIAYLINKKNWNLIK